MNIDDVHPRVLGYLGRALSLELTAVQQYMTQASLVGLCGDEASAERFREETVEEMQHSERIVQHMLQLGVAPAASQLQPVGHAPDLVGLLELNAELEQQLIDHYDEASRFCHVIHDEANGAFFQALLEHEQQHSHDLEAWLQQLGGRRRRGYALYATNPDRRDHRSRATF